MLLLLGLTFFLHTRCFCLAYNIQTYIVYTYFSVSPSVTDARVTIITPEDPRNQTYSITVTCTVHPDSDANMCEVMAMANGQTLTGEHIYVHI